jgi:Glycosyl hydrolases family 18
MIGKRPFIAYWTGEEPTGPTHSPTLADVPAALIDSIDLIIMNFIPVVKGDLDFSFLTKHNDQKTIMSWIAAIRRRQRNLPTRTKFSLSIESGDFATLNPTAFAAKVKAAAIDWEADGIDIDYEPPTANPDILRVVREIKSAFPERFILTTPIYAAWLKSEVKRLLASYVALFNVVTTMDYTEYPGFNETIDYVKQYAAAIGGEDPYSKLAIGISCTDFNNGNHTPPEDIPKLCNYKFDPQTSPGAMLYSLSYDAPGHAGGAYPYAKRFVYADAIAKLIRAS